MVRQQMPPADRLEPLVRSYAVTHPAGQVVLPQAPGWDQLLLAATGVMTVHTADAAWLVTPHRAVWAPSGVAHRIVTDGRVQVRSIYLSVGLVPDPGRCRAVDVSPLVREVVLHLVAHAPIDASDAAGVRLVEVLSDLLPGLPDAALRVPLPRDERALDVAGILLDDPACADTVDALARRVGAGRRTIERRFVEETGMGVGRWRTQVRLVEAIRRLSRGEPVTRVAVEVGYATPSAFGAAFRQVLGTSPGRYLPPSADRPIFRVPDAGR